MGAVWLRFGFGLMLLTLAGCVLPAAQTAPAPPPPAAALPPLASPFRSDLDPKWRDSTGAILWPSDDGFAGAPILLVLEPGMLIDRFGKETGHFFSPRGAGYHQRAVPYVCADMPYHVYRIDRPLLAWTGKAAAWFGEPGGATQIETDASVAQLLRDGTLSAVNDNAPKPCP